MKKTILAVLAAFVLSTSLAFGGSYTNPFQGPPGPQGEQGIQGEQGARGTRGSVGATGETGATGDVGSIGATGGVGATGSAGTNGTNGSDGNFNNRSNVIASMGAMANIPALNNHGGDSGVGVGVGSYGSNQAVALGYVQQAGKNMSYKFSAARGIGSNTKGSDIVLGGGATFSW